VRRQLAIAWRRVEAAHDQLFVARWRQGLRREARRQQDTLRALVMLESLGVDNPVAYETLDLVPYLVADLHAWHRRMGQDSLGDPGVCC
jgi:hypothetical protein